MHMDFTNHMTNRPDGMERAQDYMSRQIKMVICIYIWYIICVFILDLCNWPNNFIHRYFATASICDGIESINNKNEKKIMSKSSESSYLRYGDGKDPIKIFVKINNDTTNMIINI